MKNKVQCMQVDKTWDSGHFFIIIWCEKGVMRTKFLQLTGAYGACSRHKGPVDMEQALPSMRTPQGYEPISSVMKQNLIPGFAEKSHSVNTAWDLGVTPLLAYHPGRKLPIIFIEMWI